jgi:hypothetical protein
MEVLCTLFAKRELEVRPIFGESITFWSAKNSVEGFNVASAVGSQFVHYATTEVDELAHHLHPDKSPVRSSIFLRCQPVRVASFSDARQVVAFLESQHQFELDPCGVNKLNDLRDCAPQETPPK